ncbi:MAG: hypothetical protein NZL83_01350 [Candidatus Absconditabacterales bacterium]|nr:hypothetical protein [Candidatus Absconditabacterales bacterium]
MENRLNSSGPASFIVENIEGGTRSFIVQSGQSASFVPRAIGSSVRVRTTSPSTVNHCISW